MKKSVKAIGIIFGVTMIAGIAGSIVGGDSGTQTTTLQPKVQQAQKQTEPQSKKQVSSDPVSRENYDKIKTSMTDDGDIPATDILLLGNPYATQIDGNTKTFNWYSKDHKTLVIVEYINNRAVGKEYHDQ